MRSCQVLVGVTVAFWRLVLALYVAALVGKASAATLMPGDILAVDQQFGPVAASRLVRANPASGVVTTLSVGGFLTETAQRVAIAPGGLPVVTDSVNGLISVDPATGNQAVVSTGGLLGDGSSMYSVAFAPSGELYVAYGRADGSGLVRVDRATGAQTPVFFSSSIPRASDVAFDALGRAYLITQTSSSIDTVVRVSSDFAGFTTVTAGNFIATGTGVTVASDGSIFASALGTSAVVRVDPTTGFQTPITVGHPGIPTDVVVDGDGTLLVSSGFGQIFRINPVGFDAPQLIASELGARYNALAIVRVPAPVGSVLFGIASLGAWRRRRLPRSL